MLKEVEIHGNPGNICAVYKVGNVTGKPTKGLAWGPFGEDGIYRMLADTSEQENVMIVEYEPHVADFLEEYWWMNSES